MSAGISTHILDTAAGRPAANVRVTLLCQGRELSAACTNADGRVPAMLPEGTPLEAATYELVFEVRTYFPNGFFPQIRIIFEVQDSNSHHHVPLLLSPFGYSTYRGS